MIHSSLTAAAVRLGLSTPAVSQLMIRLERDLNIVLLERSNQGTRLTPAGAVMRDRARTLLENEDQIVRELDAYRTISRCPGFASLCCPRSPASSCRPSCLTCIMRSVS